MKKIYLVVPIMLVLVTLSVCGCGSTTTIYQPQSPAITSNPPSSTTQIWTAGPADIDYGNFQTIKTSIQGGKTVTLTWSADGNLDCFIFTENQYNNFHPMGILSGYMQHGSGSQGTINVTLQNTDTYYVILRNQSTVGLVKLYSATLTAR